MLGLILLAALSHPGVERSCRSQQEHDTTMCLGSDANPLRTYDRRLPLGRIRTGFGVCPDGYHPLTPYADGWSCVENVSPGQSNGGGDFIILDDRMSMSTLNVLSGVATSPAGTLPVAKKK